ncbi:MAG: redoxin domain-containing protein [Anaerolineae bacterium]
MRRAVPILIGLTLGLAGTAAILWYILLRPLSGAAPAVADLPAVAAVVNGEAITASMVEAEINVGRATNLLSLNRLEQTLSPLQGEDLRQAQKEAVTQLVNRHLILQAAAQDGFALSPDFIEARTQLLFGGFSRAELEAALARAGADYQDLLWWVGEVTTVEEYTVGVIMAGAAPAERQRVFNDWLNARQAQAQVTRYLDGRATSPTALAGSPAPDFELAALDGETVRLSDYQGQIVLVNFWATWCPSCIAEMPEYEEIFRRQQGEGFVVLAINLQEPETVIDSFAEGVGLTFPVLRDASGEVTTDLYQVVGMPSSFIVDRNGLIFYRHAGPMSGELLSEKLAALGLE